MNSLNFVGKTKTKQSNIQINTLPTIHSISDLYSMINEELDKFHEAKDASIVADKNYKLFVEFETGASGFEGKHMEIPNIKYKNRSRTVAKEVDLKKKKKPINNSIF